MSFSANIKNELCRIDNISDCCLNTELMAIMMISAIIKNEDNDRISIFINAENSAFIRKVFLNMKKLFKVHAEILIIKSKRLRQHAIYKLIIKNDKDVDILLKGLRLKLIKDRNKYYFEIEHKNNNNLNLKDNCCIRSYLRAAFLASGSVSNPEKAYHLEIVTHNTNRAKDIKKVMDKFDLNSKIIIRKGNYIIYLKEAENIVDFLNIIGAHKALMKFENVRILKDMRNNVNRIVNCETANLDKTVDAAIRQVAFIKYIRDNIGFNNLSNNLKEIAEIRLENKEASLRELGEKLEPKLGKSGVNHRLRKLEGIYEKEVEKKGGDNER